MTSSERRRRREETAAFNAALAEERAAYEAKVASGEIVEIKGGGGGCGLLTPAYGGAADSIEGAIAHIEWVQRTYPGQ